MLVFENLYFDMSLRAMLFRSPIASSFGSRAKYFTKAFGWRHAFLMSILFPSCTSPEVAVVMQSYVMKL